MQMPEGMKVRVGWSESRAVNAYATLGGQVVFLGGLLARLESENALAMVMAHEIAHLKYRHAAAALGRGVAVGVMLSVISAELGRTAAGALVNQAGVATLLKFNRDQERAADEAALQALAAEYGHVGGAVEMFDALLRLPGAQRESDTGVEFLRTHPLTENRRQAIADWAAANGVAPDGPRRPLPPPMRCELLSSASVRAAQLNSSSRGTRSATARRARPVDGCTGTTRRRSSRR
jgi:predicted Zn-dependent protease